MDAGIDPGPPCPLPPFSLACAMWAPCSLLRPFARACSAPYNATLDPISETTDGPASPRSREPRKGPQTLDSNSLARAIFDAMGDKQAADLVVLDIRPVSIITDFFVIGTAASARQLKAVVEGVEEALRKEQGIKPVSIDGGYDSGWVLMDYGDVVVHVFAPDQRAYYALEEIWSEAPLVARMA